MTLRKAEAFRASESMTLVTAGAMSVPAGSPDVATVAAASSCQCCAGPVVLAKHYNFFVLEISHGTCFLCDAGFGPVVFGFDGQRF